MQKMALVAAGVIFSLVAISHFIRALYAVEVLMVGKIIPIVVSPFLCIFAVLMATWMFIAAKQLH